MTEQTKLDGEFIRAVAPRFSGRKAERQAEIIDAVSDIFQDTLKKYEINTRLRVSHWMAQVSHECAGWRTTEEFASGKAYEGRRDLGNVAPGDGKRFKGRGLIQLTGRANHREMGERLNLPLEENPELAAEPETALIIACEYWKSRNINQPADDDDLIRCTRLVNGGLNGLADRRQYLSKTRTVLAQLYGSELDHTQRYPRPTLRRGSSGKAVWELQERLRKANYYLAVDGMFGPATELAVLHIQEANGLAVDGIVGAKTWNALLDM